MNPAGKTALVTGAAKRVGRAIALALAEAGCDVAIHYHRSRLEAEDLAGRIRRLGRRAATVGVDLGLPEAPPDLIRQIVGALGRLDILVNNAAVFQPTPGESADSAAWERIFRVNVVAPALLARAAAPHMREAGGGRIINLTDILADRPIRRYAAYCASKAALVSLTRCLARELAPDITVNAIAPGIAVFPEDYDADLRQDLTSRVPLAREGTPEDVAALVCFLVTRGDYITGQNIPVDGGRSAVP